MSLHANTTSAAPFVEATPGVPIIGRSQDAATVLEACFAVSARGALLYPENLPAAFFDLSSGQAGELLDKFRQFGVRLAIVCAPGAVRFSSRFTEILSNDLRVFDTPESARDWLGRQ